MVNRRDKSMTDLIVQISILRQRMHQMAREKGLNSSEVLEISQRIDLVLNELNRRRKKELL
jgi:hypothetical protein